jgi:hypothetical protein
MRGLENSGMYPLTPPWRSTARTVACCCDRHRAYTRPLSCGRSNSLTSSRAASAACAWRLAQKNLIVSAAACSRLWPDSIRLYDTYCVVSGDALAVTWESWMREKAAAMRQNHSGSRARPANADCIRRTEFCNPSTG